MNNAKAIENSVLHMYGLDPEKVQEDAYKLADILKVNRHWVHNADEPIILAMCGVILMQHLDDADKTLVMQDIYALREARPELYYELNIRIDDALINPDWAPWSMSTEQLESWIKADETQAKIYETLGNIGIGFSLVEGKNLYQALKKGKGGAAFLLVGLLVFCMDKANEIEEDKLKQELKNRSDQPKTTKYYEHPR